MKEFLLEFLICPGCLPKEYALEGKGLKRDTTGTDIVAGTLCCPRCKRVFPIKEGIAYLQLHQELNGMRYEESAMTARYLLSHYGDLVAPPANREAAYFWGTLLASKPSSAAFDAGCSVGRQVFEMGRKNGWAVGCDLSESFIKAARKLMINRQFTFSLPLEGNLRETFEISLPDSWQTDMSEFIVADAQYIPFQRNVFQQVSSLNLLDRVPYPLAHLFEMNRVASLSEATFLFADPFSWLTSPAPEEKWLGGTALGQYAGRGKDVVKGLLEGNKSILMPSWQVVKSGRHQWSLRTHRNHQELMASEFMVAKR